jgi:hypothetical protein
MTWWPTSAAGRWTRGRPPSCGSNALTQKVREGGRTVTEHAHPRLQVMIATLDACYKRCPGCGIDKKDASIGSLGVTYGLVLTQASDFDAFAAGAATSRALPPDSAGGVRGRVKVAMGGQVEVSAGGQLEVPISRWSSCRTGSLCPGR